MHLSSTLPPEVEINAIRRLDYDTEVVKTDGGWEVRNNRAATPLRSFDVSFPTAARDNAIYAAVVALYEEAEGMLHSFDFKDWATGETIAVRFDSPLTIEGVSKELDHIVQVALVEVRLAAFS